MEHLYKNKYLIALYDQDDFPFIVASNVKELALLTGRKEECLQSTLSRKKKSIYIKGKSYKIYLILYNEEEEKQL